MALPSGSASGLCTHYHGFSGAARPRSGLVGLGDSAWRGGRLLGRADAGIGPLGKQAGYLTTAAGCLL